MLWIKILIFCLASILVMFFTGNYLCFKLDFKKNIAKSITSGFIVVLVIFQILAYGISIWNSSLMLLVASFVFVTAILMIVSLRHYMAGGGEWLVFRFWQGGTEKADDVLVKAWDEDTAAVQRKRTQTRETEKYILAGVIIISICVQTFLSVNMHHTDDDDAYFITIATTTIEKGELTSDAQLVSTGIESDQIDTRPNTSTWEYFIAVLSVVFRIEPAILAHTVLPILLIPLSYLAVYLVAASLVARKARLCFMLVFTLLNFFGGYAVYSTACFLLLRIWQGKAVLVNIIFPILLASSIELMRAGNRKRKYWIFNSLVLVAGVCVSVIGVYLTPMYYVIIGVPYFIACGFKGIRKMLVPAVLSLIPCGIFALISLMQILNTNAEYLKAAAPDWNVIFRGNMMSGYYSVFFVAALVYILIRGDRIQRLVVCGSTAFAFLTFINPVTVDFVAQKITGVDVYWRVYWTLPFYYAIALFLSDLMVQINRFVRIIYAILLIISLNYMGDFLYQPIYYTKHENVYKLPDAVINISDYVLENNSPEEKPNILLPENLSAKARQYTAEVTTIFSRNLYQGGRGVPGTDLTLSAFYYPLYSGETKDTVYIHEMLGRLQVNWLVLPYQMDLSKSSEGIEFSAEIDGYYIYEIY